jgi:trimethylamine--corrinoid protein Co-methyltransferase
MPGATCPLPLPAAYVEAIATNLGAFALFRLLGVDIGICPTVFPFDMRAGAIAMGTPEHAIGWFMADQICRYYNMAPFDFCPAFQTNAVAADAHSMTTRVAFATAGALYGVRGFGYGGQLGIDKIFSAEQLVLDVEIIRYLRHLVAPIPFASANEAVDMLKEVGPGGDFLTHSSTLAGCRGQWSSPLFRNESPEQAACRGSNDARADIIETIRRAEAAHDYRLEPAKVRELDRIYKRFAATVGS